MAFEQADGEAAKPGKVVGHASLACAALVLVERDIEVIFRSSMVLFTDLQTEVVWLIHTIAAAITPRPED